MTVVRDPLYMLFSTSINIASEDLSGIPDDTSIFGRECLVFIRVRRMMPRLSNNHCSMSLVSDEVRVYLGIRQALKWRAEMSMWPCATCSPSRRSICHVRDWFIERLPSWPRPIKSSVMIIGARARLEQKWSPRLRSRELRTDIIWQGYELYRINTSTVVLGFAKDTVHVYNIPQAHLLSNFSGYAAPLTLLRSR